MRPIMGTHKHASDSINLCSPGEVNIVRHVQMNACLLIACSSDLLWLRLVWSSILTHTSHMFNRTQTSHEMARLPTAGPESCLRYNSDLGAVTLAAHKDYEAGEEVFDSYGPKLVSFENCRTLVGQG